MDRLTFIGTSHIAKESVDKVAKVLEQERPDILALELDPDRFHGLMQKQRGRPGLAHLRRMGVKAFVLALLGMWAEEKLGKMVGVAPGDEMKNAIRTAKRLKIDIMLIDQDLSITLRRLSSQLTWRERWNFVKDIVKGVVFRKTDLGDLGSIDLSKVPESELIRKMMDIVKVRYPTFYRVLVAERNVVMADNLLHMLAQFPEARIVAVVGAGHVEGIKELMNVSARPVASFSFSVDSHKNPPQDLLF